MRRKSIARRGSQTSEVVESQLAWISPSIIGGMLNKRSRKRAGGFDTPWAMRYITIDVNTSELVYHVDAGG